MKLIATNKVLKSYKELLTFVFKVQRKFTDFSNNINPYMDERNCETVIDEESGKEYEKYHGNADDEYIYNCKIEEYKAKNKPSLHEIKKYVDALRDSMRDDFGTDKYSD